MSLQLEMRFSGTLLATGTGFVCRGKSGYVLVTNRHNVTGRHQETGQPIDTKTGGVPNELVIRHHSIYGLGLYTRATEPLYDGERARWIEHPTLGEKADLVALPLTQVADARLHPHLAGDDKDDLRVDVTDVVSVIGYPFGLTVSGTAVWASGFMASEPELPFNEPPVFIIDCRTRKGQSGSAVIAFRGQGAMVKLADGKMAMFDGPVWRFLGIYSGRIREDADLGLVWKAEAIRPLLAVA